MPGMGDITKRLKQEAVTRARQQKKNNAATVKTAAAKRQTDLDEARRLTRAVLAKLKAQTGWQLVDTENRFKQPCQVAGWLVATYTTWGGRDGDVKHSIWLLEDGSYSLDYLRVKINYFDDLDLVIEGLRKL